MMNLFFVIGNTVLTPSLSGAVLKGTNRTYFLDILKEKNIKVEVRDIYTDEIVEAHQRGNLKEAFGSGSSGGIAYCRNYTW